MRSRHELQQRQLEQQLAEQQRLQQQQQQKQAEPSNASVKTVDPTPTPPIEAPPPPPLAPAEASGDLQSTKAKLDAAEAEAASLRRENAGIRAELGRLATRLAEAEAAAATPAAAAASRAAQPPPPPQQQPSPQPPRSTAELEACRRRQRNAEAEAAAANARADKLTELTERQRDRLAESAAQLEKQRGVIKKLKSTLEARDAQAKELQQQLRQQADRISSNSAAKAKAAEAAEAAAEAAEARADSGTVESELAALGHQCRGERHADIIRHQREALSELRQRLKDLELGRPTTNSHDHTVQQVALLKRELAEMRSRQALAETGRYSQTPTGLAGDLDKELGSTGLARIATTNAELQTERSTHAQAAASLEASERCYLSLVSALTGALRLTGPLPGQLPMSQAADVAERRRLTSERDKAAELIAERVRQMRERAERKDQLLEGYDGDLARLRQALQLAEARSAQVDALAEQLRARTEESELLRASLGQAKAATANGGGGGGGGATSAIVAKSRPRPAEAAPAADDSDGEEKEAARKRAIRERMKRKDYEIASLKAELRSREKDLRNASTKLSRLQTSLGLPHESELLGGGEV
ncbi:hypothetical protein BOX15_Mlig004584g3 [Macrostomum lignano]|uniref:Uncharacterized protein n=1 Tax=Macrostomum lignano TaxID=282301 RepID=A0A267DM22_9PLAT|nr:hypothetical protein BOX15_Mlig004584g3 [Macrostomum lignano]